MANVPLSQGFKRRIRDLSFTVNKVLFSPWVEIKDHKIERRISLLSGFLFCYSLLTFIGAITTVATRYALGIFLAANGIILLLVYLVSRTKYYKTAILLTMIVPVLPVFYQLIINPEMADPFGSMMWFVFPLLVCALLASTRLTIIVSISYIFLIVLTVTIIQTTIPVLDAAIPFILIVGIIVFAITLVRQREQSEVKYETEERLAKQQQMLNREKFFRTILDSFGTGVIIADPESFLVKDANAAMMDLLGRQCSEIIGEKVTDIITIPGLLLNRSMFTSMPSNVFEGEIISRNNTSTPVMVSFSELRSENASNIFITFVDITTKKETEQRGKYLEQELITNSRLASLGQMAAGVAHEINNPLSTIMLHTDLLLESNTPDEFRRDIVVIDKQVERITKIVSGMLNFANPNRSSGIKLDINEVLDETLELYSYELKLSNIILSKQFAKSLLPVVANRTHLQQVFFNIINNAQKEMVEAHGSGLLTVATDSVGDSVRISISDTGRGISEENMVHLFEPFFTTRGIGKGTGLGLSICHGIIASLGGTIWAENRVSGGTTFVVELPVSDISEVVPSQEILPDLDESSLNLIKVLIVDDELPILDAIDRSLSTQGYAVTTAKNSADARTLVNSSMFDVILLDVKMPGMSGIDFYRELEEKNPEIVNSVIFLTGDILDQGTHTFLQERQVPYLVKPVSAGNIMRKIQEIVIGK